MLSRIDPRQSLGHMGPNGRPRWNRAAKLEKHRINPHLEARARLRRERRISTPGAVSRVATHTKTLFKPADDALNVLVFVQEEQLWINAEAELVGSTRELFPEARITLVTDLPVAPQEAGVDRWVQTFNFSLPVILDLIDTLNPDHVVFGDAGTFKSSARHLAAKTRCTAAFNVVDQRRGKVTYTLDGGRQEATIAVPFLLCLPRKTCAVYEGDLSFSATSLELSSALSNDGEIPFRDEGLLPVDAQHLSLKEADLVVSAGDGLTAWPEFFQLANQINAAVAGSRVVCDRELLPRSRQVGASGELIEARCYLALGISGAPQHLQGIQGCKYVMAINTDPYAPIMKRADLAIQGDANTILPALSRLLKEIETPC